MGTRAKGGAWEPEEITHAKLHLPQPDKVRLRQRADRQAADASAGQGQDSADLRRRIDQEERHPRAGLAGHPELASDRVRRHRAESALRDLHEGGRVGSGRGHRFSAGRRRRVGAGRHEVHRRRRALHGQRSVGHADRLESGARQSAADRLRDDVARHGLGGQRRGGRYPRIDERQAVFRYAAAIFRIFRFSIPRRPTRCRRVRRPTAWSMRSCIRSSNT